MAISVDIEKKLHGFALKVKLESDGSPMGILGASGSGKSMTLRCIAGIQTPDSGRIVVNDKVLFDSEKKINLKPQERKVGYLFQNYALFPTMTVEKNIACGYRGDKKHLKAKVADYIERYQLNGLEKRYPGQLSGGQQQRVAIARALAVKPRVLLLDEPLGALDLKLRKDMQSELKAIQQRLGITFIYVTHDQEEALSMSDTIVVMDGGVIQQIGSPTDIYNEPQNAFVADFIGESNIVDGVMLSDYNVEFQGMRCRCVDKGFGLNEPVDVVVRPEDIDMVPPGEGMLSGDVTSVTFKGVHYEIIVDIKGFKWMIQTTEKAEVGDRIGISIKPDEIQIMKKSEYSGLYGDYSSFSEEFDELSDPNAELTDEDEVSEIGE